MRSYALALSTAALALSSAALAQPAPAERPARAAKPDLTRTQAQERAEAMFARMDANRDGTLSQADRAARKAAMFDRLDTDRSGAVSQAELEAQHAARAGKRPERMARRGNAPALTEAQRAERRAERFARIDSDRNGGISRAEFDAPRGERAGRQGGERVEGQRMGGRRGGPAQGFAKRLDGPVTRQAFVDRALARFDRTDADRNGTVTQAERNAARDAMREQWQARRAARQQG